MDTAGQLPLEMISTVFQLRALKATGLQTAISNMGRSMAAEFATEWAQKFPEYLAEPLALSEKHGGTLEEQAAWYARQVFNADRAWRVLVEEGFWEGLVGGILGGAGGSVSVARSFWHARWALDFQKMHREIHDTVEESGIQDSGSDVATQALDVASPLMQATVLIPAEELALLRERGTDAVSALGISETRLAEARRTGRDIPVKISSLHASLKGDAFNQVLDIVRADPAAPNALEAGALDIEAVVHETMHREERREAERADANRAERELRRKLAAVTGSETVADANASLAGAAAWNMQERYGMDAAALLGGMDIMRGEEGAPQPQGALNSPSISRDDKRVQWATGLVNTKIESVPYVSSGDSLFAGLEISRENRGAIQARLKSGIKERVFRNRDLGEVRLGHDGLWEMRERVSMKDIAPFAILKDIVEGAHWYRREPDVDRPGRTVFHTATPFLLDGVLHVAHMTLKQGGLQGGRHWNIHVLDVMDMKEGSGSDLRLPPHGDGDAQAWRPAHHGRGLRPDPGISLYDVLSRVNDSRRRLPKDVRELAGESYEASQDREPKADLFSRIAEEIAECVGRIA